MAGVLWVGSAFLFVGFTGPSAAEDCPSAMPLLTATVKKRKEVRVIIGLGLANVISGCVMWLRDMGQYGSFGDWVGSSFGLVITIGAVLATIAAFVGSFGVGVNVERLVDLGNRIVAGAADHGTAAGDGADLRALERHGKMDLLLLAVTAMATARYW